MPDVISDSTWNTNQKIKGIHIIGAILPLSPWEQIENKKETAVSLAQEEDVSRRLAGHRGVETIKEECNGFSDAGKSWEKGSSAMAGGTKVQITQCPFLQQTSMQWATKVCLAR